MKKIIFTILSSMLIVSACSPQPTNNTSSSSSANPSSTPTDTTTKVTFAQAKTVIEQRCNMCHGNGKASGGVSYSTPELIKANASRIKIRAVVTRDMPKNNATNITEEERTLLGKWVDEGANIN